MLNEKSWLSRPYADPHLISEYMPIKWLLCYTHTASLFRALLAIQFSPLVSRISLENAGLF